MIPYGRQEITDEDVDAVVRALKSDFITQGPYVEQFENDIKSYCGAKYAVAVSSCTAGLHIAYAALGLNEHSLLWTVPNTFAATANAALYCNAIVDFVDIDARTYLMCPRALEEKLIVAKANGRIPDIVAPVHFSGQSCDMEAISKLSEEYGFKVVEDAAHAIGASYEGEKIGGCMYSSATVFSFHPVKIITTAEGGVITTNDDAVYRALLKLRTHGITKVAGDMEKHDPEPWFHEQQNLGFHYRITDIQCALGSSQMKRLDQYVMRRVALAQRYDEKLKDLPLTLPTVQPAESSSWHLYVVQINDTVQKSRHDVFCEMRDKGVGVNVHYIPVHRHPYYQSLGFSLGDFPVSEHYYERAITLPLYPGLTEQEQDYVCYSLRDILEG